MADVGVWQGLNQTTGNMLNTGMRLMEYSSRHNERQDALAIAKDRYALEKEAADRQAKAFEHAEKERQIKEKEDNAFVPLSLAAPGMAGMEKSKAGILEAIKSAGHDVKEVGGETYITRRGLNFVKDYTKSNSDFMQTNLNNMLVDLQTQSAAIEQQRGELGDKAKPEQLAQLDAQQKAIKIKIAGLVTNQRDVQAHIAQEAAKEKAERTEEFGYGQRRYISGPNKGKVVGVPTNPNGAAGDATAQAAKHEKLVQSFEKQADTEAQRETRMKFNINPTMEQGPDGKIRMVWPNNPEATQHYLKKRQELTDKRVSRAVKNKALPKEYAPEEPMTGAPKAGDVLDGYRFNGGNPGVPGNWTKVN